MLFRRAEIRRVPRDMIMLRQRNARGGSENYDVDRTRTDAVLLSAGGFFALDF